MRIAIVGSRDYPFPHRVIDYINSLSEDTIVVSGGARGVDQIAETSAIERGLTVNIIDAEWEQFGRAAGMIRNTIVIRECDALTAFWDGKSKGTKDAIDKAKKAGKPVTVYYDKRHFTTSNSERNKGV